LPRLSHPSALPALQPCGLALPVAPPNASAGCPASCIFRLCRRSIFESPRISIPSAHPALQLKVAPQSAFPVAPADAFPRSPRFLHLPALPASIFRLPRISIPLAPPVLKLQVAPQLCSPGCACRSVPRVAPVSRSSGCVGDGATSCLVSRVLRRLWRSSFRLPLGLALPVAPPGGSASFLASATFRLCLGFESSGFPESSLLRRRLMDYRVASALAPSGLPSLRLQVALNPASTAGSMMTSRFSSNFASAANPWMNLRIQSGFTLSRLTLDALSISFRSPPCWQASTRFTVLQPYPASSFQPGTASPLSVRLSI
jgi:hypothetical protein